MTLSSVPAPLAQAHRLVAELRMLQGQMNRTVEQICELVGSQDAAHILRQARAEGPLERTTHSPQFLGVPLAEPCIRAPKANTPIGTDAHFFSDHKHALVQVLQQSLQRHADSRYSLILNYADFDGDLMSVVMDARALLIGLKEGLASFQLITEMSSGQYCGVFAKLAWRVGSTWHEKTLEVQSNTVCACGVDIERFDPQQVEALDLHLMFNPESRGSIEIRRVQVAMSTQASVQELPVPAGVFE